MNIILITRSKQVAQDYTDFLRLRLKKLGYHNIASNVEWIKSPVPNNYYAVQLSDQAMQVFNFNADSLLERAFKLLSNS